MFNKIPLLKNIASSCTVVLCGHIKGTCIKNQIGKVLYHRFSIMNFSTQSYRILTLARNTNVSSSSVSINYIIKISEWNFVPI